MFDIPSVFDDNNSHMKLWSGSWSAWLQPLRPLVGGMACSLQWPEGLAGGS